MMNSLTSQLVVVAIGSLVVLPPIGAVLAAKWWQRSRARMTGRRNPLTQPLLRPPGHRLSQQIRERSLDAAFALMTAPLAGYSCFLFALLAPHLAGDPPNPTLLWFSILATAIAAVWSGVHLIRAYRDLTNYRLGWDGELATAEELNKLMKAVYEVFHDVPCDGFNIDHVVVGGSGVFAIETKARSKQKRGDAKDDRTAVFDGRAVDFAGWRDTKCLDQAKRQAEWVGRWLSQATGERTTATPVLAVPGWYIERKGSGSVRVINPREAGSMVSAGGGAANRLDAAAIKRIAYQLESRCRQVSVERAGKLDGHNG